MVLLSSSFTLSTISFLLRFALVSFTGNQEEKKLGKKSFTELHQFQFEHVAKRYAPIININVYSNVAVALNLSTDAGSEFKLISFYLLSHCELKTQLEHVCYTWGITATAEMQMWCILMSSQKACCTSSHYSSLNIKVDFLLYSFLRTGLQQPIKTNA